MIFRLLIVLLFLNINAFSQNSFTKHNVLKGDNIYAIAKQYGLKTKDIIAANPNVSNVLKLNSVLLIPTTDKTFVDKKEQNALIRKNSIQHEILAKETLWSISKKYNVTVEDLKKINPELAFQGLKMGQQINIPSNRVAIEKAIQTEIIKSPERLTEKTVENPSDLKIKKQRELELEVSREVLPKETKYKIAKEFGITVAELENQNPEIKEKLPIGYILKIKTSKEITEESLVKTAIKDIQLPNDDAITSKEIEKKNEVEVFKFLNSGALKDQIVFVATDNIGTRYRIGGTSKSGFDCSGLIYSAFGDFDIKLPRTSIEQSRTGKRVTPEEAEKGDLIFFKTNGRHRVNHVGMVVEVSEDEIKFVHASTSRGVMISSTKEGYYKKAFSHVNRVLE